MTCPCRKHTVEYRPSAARVDIADDDRVRNLSVEQRAEFNKLAEQYLVDMSRHEAAHAVGAAFFGRRTEYLTIGDGQPHARYSPDDRNSLFANCIATLSGYAAQHALAGDLWEPSTVFLVKFIRWARAEEGGGCDYCVISKALVSAFGDMEDLEISAIFKNLWRITTAAFCDDEVVSATLTLGRAVHEKTLVQAGEIEAVLAEFDIGGALVRATAAFDLKGMFAKW